MSEWPDLSDELARKALTVFESATYDHLVKGDLSKHDLRLVVDTLTDTISGLVSMDVLNTIYSTRKELDL